MKSQELSPGVSLYIFDELETTMVEARKRAQTGASQGTTVVALKQTQGRGRLGRTWISEPGNLYMTTLLKPALEMKDAGKISLIVGLALKNVLESYVKDSEVQLKWPNDVLIKGQKVAGILLEMIPGVEEGSFILLVGIGVNVSHYPENVRYPATSLASLGVSLDPTQLIQPIVTTLLKMTENFVSDPQFNWKKDWMASAYGLERAILLTHDSGKIVAQGIYQGIDHNGSLVIQDDTGNMCAYYVGDVVFQKVPLKTSF
ncbi:Bifunctional ligase/repressor BirA [Candidatus Bealeia paramacronuclearis]|uniref:biotin--[biotin carboxyl-carrier protein] ligase n=1 Tax=Candidatus Bealeia paramacronuclearis TaxID=1921001 RepID=A0ABZ2C4E0_9PROT|nr:Bifunctional ligase/repressor BirA [Candidatus Bealeia paramacronuclearis]